MINRTLQRIQQHYVRPSHPIAFSAPGTVQRYYKNNFQRVIPARVLENTLAAVDSYTLHREFKKPKYRNPFFIYERRQQVQMDLIDVRQLAKENDGITFLLVCIDCFSKKVWVIPLEKKNAKTSLAAITKVIGDMVQPPKSVFFDRGTEFKNNLVRTFLRENNIKMTHPNSEMKACIVERVNRTLQDLMYRYMTENETLRYIDVLADLVKTYNNRGHRTLQNLTPNDAEKVENDGKVRSALNDHYTKFVSLNRKPKFKVGEIVRVNGLASKFARGYHQRFTREHFKIVEVKTRMPIPMYILQSLNNNEIIRGGFYAGELQSVKGGVFKMTVLKSRMYRGKLQHFVKWRDFDDTHNEWIDATNVTQEYIRPQA